MINGRILFFKLRRAHVFEFPYDSINLYIMVRMVLARRSFAKIRNPTRYYTLNNVIHAAYKYNNNFFFFLFLIDFKTFFYGLARRQNIQEENPSNDG